MIHLVYYLAEPNIKFNIKLINQIKKNKIKKIKNKKLNK